MTLTLDEVRKTKFHMARRTGYEVSEVDLFVDRVEASFAQLTEENTMLKQQVETLKQAQQNAQQRDDRREDRREPSNDELAKPQQGHQGQQPGQHAPQGQQAPQAQQQRPQPLVQQPHQATSAPVGSAEKIVVTTSAEASPAVVRLVQMATEQAETLVNEAESDAKRKLDEANQRAHQITTDARTKADRVESEARVSAEKMTSEARSNADKVTADARAKSENLERETATRRTQMFADLESERDRLRESVTQLRGFEQSYRQNFTQHLKQTISSIESGRFEPGDKPGLLDAKSAKHDGAKDDEPSGRRSFGSESKDSSSSTPRLDALLGDNH